MAVPIKKRGAEFDAVVVGSGPNGLAAAITMARAGCSVRVLEANATIGGGTRSSSELTLPGFVHDLCSAVHPLALASPFFRELPLERFGLEWIHPPIPLAHPLEGGAAASLYRDLDITADSLGEKGYRNLMRPLVRNWEKLLPELLQPLLHFPRHAFALARFGAAALFPAKVLARARFRREPARALFAGIAAHSFLPLEAAASSAVGLLLGAAGHAVGWPVPRGGSQTIANALAGYLRELGGIITPNEKVKALSQLPSARAILLDLTSWQFARLAGEQLPARYSGWLARFRHAPGVFKIDYALEGAVPWAAEECRRAGTLHLGGTLDEIAFAEREVAAGRIPPRPFVLLAQPSLFDETRAPDGKHTLWAYCHVPFASTVDMTDRIEAQIERFAPGFRKLILVRQTMTTADLEMKNANLIGGDINGGAGDFWQMLARPVPSPHPYRTPMRGVYLCSASTPPGGGVHGMCGYHAARTALRDMFR